MSNTPCYNEADIAWVGICTVLVLGMTPALGFFEAGLLRAKNTVSILAQVFGGFILMSFMWFTIGYSLVFGEDVKGIIGNPRHAFFIGVSYEECSENRQIPEILFALFQMMFAAITPLLMTGGFAERIRWKVFLAYIIFWELIVYYPIAHWVWGGGFLSKHALDFAGGIVIHATAGAGSLVLSILLGKRQGFEKYHGEFPPSNLPLAAVGAALLYVGWFGFNAGSALASDTSALRAVASTQIAAVTSGMVWLALTWWKAKPTLVSLMNGVIAGLAGITPASGYIGIQAAAIVGVAIGLASYFSIKLLKEKLHIDDALDVSSVHGVPGIVGSLAIGVCTKSEYNPLGASSLIYGASGTLLGYQVAAVLLAVVWSGFWTFVIAMVLQALPCGPGRLRIQAELESEGLDARYHGEAAYDLNNEAEHLLN